MQNRFISILIILCLNISCKKENLNPQKKILLKKEESLTKVVSINTSYKSNIRLFGDFYYLMPQLEVNKNTKSSKNITLVYGNKSIVLDKYFIYKDSLLQEINLIGNRNDGMIVLKLLTQKYGKSKYLENDEIKNQTELLATKILEINYSDNTFGRIKYDKNIHKEISEKEFQKHLETGFFIGKPKVANSKLHILLFGSDSFQKVMKDITKDELVRIDVKVAVSKKNHTITKKYCTHIWEDGKKEIRLDYIKNIVYSNKKLEQIDNSYGDLILSYRILNDKLENNVNEKKVESLEELQKKSLEDI